MCEDFNTSDTLEVLSLAMTSFSRTPRLMTQNDHRKFKCAQLTTINETQIMQIINTLR